VTILGNLEGCHIHGVELYVVSAVVVYHLVGEYTPAIGIRIARAFPVEANHLRGSMVELVDGGYSSLVYAVKGVRYPVYLAESLGIDCSVACSSVKRHSDSFHLTRRAFPP
jgi:hypothetical protein